MQKALILIGILITLGGISGIIFVTIPSISEIASGARDILDEHVKQGVFPMITAGGFILYFTTSVFIILTIAGIALSYRGVTSAKK